MTGYREYGWQDNQSTYAHRYFMPKVLDLLPHGSGNVRVLDVGCGNGYLSGCLRERGFDVVGIDLSEKGVAIARENYPRCRFEVLAADDHVLDKLGSPPFDIVISTEVVEHLYDPRSYARGCFHALKPGGRFICSTPYHGYFKNLGLALCGAWDSHANPLWDGGHIKLWSRATLSKLLTETGFLNLQFKGAGRLPFLWKSMLISGDRPVQ
jgi:2-polyprenyl-3-methyl-5-hydroxy-6-metoxy-1,4-benzoquinol methylase